MADKLNRQKFDHVDMPDYVLVYKENNQPQEHSFTAISDDQALGLMQKQYSTVKWKLYRTEGEERIKVGAFPEKPGERVRKRKKN